jgi:hypothetical protein
MHLYPIDGAASRVAADATAFPYRDGGWAGVIVGVDPDPANAGTITRWAQDYWRDLHPTAAGGGYVNFLMDEGQDRSAIRTAGTMTGWPGSRAATTRTTPSASTRTSSRLVRHWARGRPPGAGRPRVPGARRAAACHLDGPLAVEDVCGLAQAGL